jgi:hypothetical protein
MRKAIAFLAVWLAAGAPPREGNAGGVGIQMRNVNITIAPAVTLQIRSMRGVLQPLSAERPVTLDMANSFTVEVDSGTLSIDTASLSQVLNTYVFAYEGAPLKKISMSAKGNRLVQKGVLHKGVDLPYEMEGSISATPDGNIRMHVDKIKAEHVPFKGLLHFLGEDLSKVINLNEARGVRMEGDDILMYPERMLPPPHIKGKITEVHVEGNNVVQTIRGDKHEAPLQLPAPATNYIYHRGGVLRFGKLTMSDADLEIIDENPKTPFDFSLVEYNRQLVAGYSKNTPSHGLIVHMPDFSTLK